MIYQMLARQGSLIQRISRNVNCLYRMMMEPEDDGRQDISNGAARISIDASKESDQRKVRECSMRASESGRKVGI